MSGAGAIALFVALAPAPAQDEVPKTYALPADGSAVVLSLDWRMIGVPRESERPHLEVRADGTLVVPDRTGGDAHQVDRLAPDELQALLRFVLDEHALLAFEEDAVIAALPPARCGTGVQATVVAVDLPGRGGEARFEALETLAPFHPGIEALQHFHAAVVRLRGLMNAVRAGGRERAAELLALANERVAAAHAGLAPLTLDDVRGVGTPGERTIVRIDRREGERGHLFVTILVDGGDAPRIVVSLERGA